MSKVLYAAFLYSSVFADMKQKDGMFTFKKMLIFRNLSRERIFCCNFFINQNLNSNDRSQPDYVQV